MTSWDFFPERELKCSHCGEEHMDPHFMKALVKLRRECGFPFNLNSAYRCKDHPDEKKKTSRRIGAHRLGRAVDIRVRGANAHRLLRLATKMGVLGIGVARTFLHIDNMDSDWGQSGGYTRPSLWTYPEQ